MFGLGINKLGTPRDQALPEPETLLFANDEEGTFLDFTTTQVYADTAGTDPAEVGEGIALTLDKSQGGPGPELVTNGDFSDGLTGWTSGAFDAATLEAGGARIERSSDPALNSAIIQASIFETGKVYRISYDVVSGSGNAGTALLINGVNASSVVGSYSIVFTAPTVSFEARCYLGNFAVLDNISVREIPGTHSTQATSAARPIFGRVPVGGRRNLLLRTEEFGNAYYSKAGSTSATGTSVTFSASSGDYLGNNAVVLSAITGETFTISGLLSCEPADVGETIDVGFDLSGETNRFSSPVALSETPTPVSFSWTLTANGNVGFRVRNIGATVKSFTLDNFQIEKASTATPYQKVVTQHDITEAGIPSIYKAFFDKADDILPVTLPTITGGTVALVGTSGIWIEEDWGFTAGTLNIGPTTIAGLPAGILSVVGDLCAVIINDRAWTAAEYAGVVSWGKARGAPGVFSLGEELVTNGDLSSATGWTVVGTQVSISGGVAPFTGSAAYNVDYIEQAISVSASDLYLVSLEVKNYVSGGPRLDRVGAQTVASNFGAGNGVKDVVFAASNTSSSYFRFTTSGGGFEGEIDNISVRKLELIP
jgi:hypothetical protein